jgi:hypothetical protein
MLNRTQEAALKHVEGVISGIKVDIEAIKDGSSLHDVEKKVMEKLESLEIYCEKFSLSVDIDRLRRDAIERLFNKAGSLEYYHWQAELGLKYEVV